MASKASIIGSFIESAPPGELFDVVKDANVLAGSSTDIPKSQLSAFRKYNEEQCTTIKLPSSGQEAIICSYNALGDDKYFDVGSSTTFDVNHATQKATNFQSYNLSSENANFIQSALKSFSAHSSEHYSSSAIGVYPYENDSQVAIVLVANKYSPGNFWNGRWRSRYVVNPSSGAISGKINFDIHYYEDGNVRLVTEKSVTLSAPSSNATDVIRMIASAEKKYQEDLNRAFVTLNEGTFKGLRRQLPVTRQKVEWDKISGYRLGQDIGGGRTR